MEALAFPDGTIAISGGLLEFLKYKDELKGIFIHEANHIRRHHQQIVEAILKKAKTTHVADLVKDQLRVLGLQYLQEAESDLRWLVEDMRHRRVNPFGLLVFFERFDEFMRYWHQNTRGDLVHGSLEDRALNTESVFYFMDMNQLTGELSEFSAEFKQGVSAFLPYDRFLLLHEVEEALIGEDYERRQLRREELTGEISTDELPMAIKGILRLIEARRAHRKQVEDDRESTDRLLLYNLVTRVDNELFSEEKWPDPHRRKLARSLYYELYIGLTYLYPGSSDKPLPDEELRTRQKDDAEPFRMDGIPIMGDILESDLFVQIPENIRGLYENLCRELAASLKLNTAPTEKGLDIYFNQAVALADRLQEIHKRKGVTSAASVPLPTCALQVAINNVSSASPEWKDTVLRKADALGIHLNGNIGLTLAEEIHGRSMMNEIWQKALTENKAFDIKDYQDIAAELQRLVQGKNPAQFLELLKGFKILFMLSHGTKIWSDTLPDARGDSYGRRGEAYAEKMDYILFRLYEHGLIHFQSSLSLDEIPMWDLTAFTALIYENGLDSTSRIRTREGEVPSIEISDVNGVAQKFTYEIEDASDKTRRSDPERSIGNALHPKDAAYFKKRQNQLISTVLQTPRTLPELVKIGEILNRAFYKSDELGLTQSPTLASEFWPRLMAKYLVNVKNWQEFAAAIEAFAEKGIDIVQLAKENQEIFGAVMLPLWENLPASPTRNELKTIAQCLGSVQDPFLRLQLMNYYYDHLWPYLNFHEKLNAIFDREHSDLFDPARLDRLMETEARTSSELHEIKDRISREWDLFMKQGSSAVGVGVILNMVRFGASTNRDFLFALLNTFDSDFDLKMVLFQNLEARVFGYKDPDVDYEEPDESEALQIAELRAELAMMPYKTIFSMTKVGKYALLRRLLAGEKGLVSNKNNRSSFLQLLLNRLLEKDSNGSLTQTLTQVVTGLGAISSWKTLYFALQAVISDRMALPPRKTSKWRDIFEQVISFENRHLLSRIKSDKQFDMTRLASLREEFIKAPWAYEKAAAYYSEEILRQRLSQLQDKQMKAEKKSEEETPHRLTPLGLILQIARHVGSIGIRFLQLLPQFVSLTDEQQDEFSTVYDANRGQSKGVAVSVLEREWGSFWDEVETVEKRVGGGSLMTVFRITLKARDELDRPIQRVIKVLNPNLLFLLDRTFGFLNELIDKLIALYGEEFEIAKMILNDVYEWIKRDVNFEGFLEKDRQFKAQVEAENKSYRDVGFKYEVYVPKTYGPESKYFIHEEFIEGETLTHWKDLEAKGHDMKQIVSLLVKSYVAQLHHPDGLIHSDVHIGNFMITEDGRIAILDRNFYLKLTPAMRDLVNSMMNPFAEGIVDKIIALGGKPITDEQRNRLMKSWQKARNQIVAGDWQGFSAFLIDLRKNGVKMPIEMTLVFKNLNALQQMAKKAGFGNLMNAYFYRPPQTGSSSAPSKSLSPRLSAAA